jgi:trigger factor
MAKNLTVPEFPRAEYEERAKRFVTLGLLLAAVIKDHSVKVEPQELRAKVEELASIYDDAPKVVNWYFSNKERMLEVESSLLEEKSINLLAQQVKVSEKPISYKDAVAKRGNAKE